MKNLSFILIASFFLGCASEPKVHQIIYKSKKRYIQDGTMGIYVDKLYSGKYLKDYFAEVRIKNVDRNSNTFALEQIELVDAKGENYEPADSRRGVYNGISYKDVFTKIKLQGGQIMRGKLLFETERGYANSKDLTLRIGGKKFQFTKVKVYKKN